MDEAKTTVKRTARTKKTTSGQTVSTPLDVQHINTINFDELVAKIFQTKEGFDNLQKEMSQAKQDWIREQKQHEADMQQQKAQEELERKREQETYQYSTALTRKRAEDEFQDKKLAWEKELAQRKEELESQKRELEQLRKLAAEFDNQKETAVKEAESLLEKQLTEKFVTEKILKEQEFKAEKDILNLKIANLETDNSRLTKEIETLKRSFDEATRQVKEIAVKVIESGSNQPKPQVTLE